MLERASRGMSRDRLALLGVVERCRVLFCGRTLALVATAFAIAWSGLATAQELPGLEVERESEPQGEAPTASIAPETTPEDDRAIAERLRAIYSTLDQLADVAVDVQSG